MKIKTSPNVLFQTTIALDPTALETVNGTKQNLMTLAEVVHARNEAQNLESQFAHAHVLVRAFENLPPPSKQADAVTRLLREDLVKGVEAATVTDPFEACKEEEKAPHVPRGGDRSHRPFEILAVPGLAHRIQRGYRHP